MPTPKKSFHSKPGRPLATNLQYFGLDIDFDNDPKFSKAEELILDRGGTIMECLVITKVAIRILSYIYSKGYYAHLDNTFLFTISKSLHHYGVNSTSVRRILDALIDTEFIHKPFIEKYNILTSRGIQKRWSQAIKNMRRDAKVDPLHDLLSEADLVSSEQKPISSEQTIVDAGNNSSLLGVSASYTIEDIKGNNGEPLLLQPSIHTPPVVEKKIERPVEPLPKTETPIAQPPLGPLKNEFANKLPDDTLLRTVEECADIYMNHSMYEKSRNDLMKITFDPSIPGYEDYDDWTSKLREWNTAYSEWLIFTRGDTLKTLRDYVIHIRQKLPDHVRRGNYDPKKGFDRRRGQRSKAEIKIPWNTPAFIELWRVWKEYLSEQFSGLEYSVSAEQAALTRLTHCSGGQEPAAIEVIQAAMAAASRYLNPIHKTNGKQSNAKEPTFGGIPKSKLENLYNMEVKVNRRD